MQGVSVLLKGQKEHLQETIPRAVVKGDTERDGDTGSKSSSPLYLYPDLPTNRIIAELGYVMRDVAYY